MLRTSMHLTRVLISIVIRDDITKTPPAEIGGWCGGLGCGDGVVHSVYDFCEDWDIGSEKG